MGNEMPVTSVASADSYRKYQGRAKIELVTGIDYEDLVEGLEYWWWVILGNTSLVYTVPMTYSYLCSPLVNPPPSLSLSIISKHQKSHRLMLATTC